MFVVSELWQSRIKAEFGRTSTRVGNGVDTERFTNHARALDQQVRDQYGINGSPVLFSVGGVEEHKNSVRILEAFRQLLRFTVMRSS